MGDTQSGNGVATVDNGSSAPFKRPMLRKANELASKVNTPLADLVFKVIIFVGPAIVWFCWDTVKGWGVQQVIASPQITALETSVETTHAPLVQVQSTANSTSAQLSATTDTLAKVSDFLKENAKAVQALDQHLGVLEQKVEDGQQRAQNDISRLDSRLDSIQARQR